MRKALAALLLLSLLIPSPTPARDFSTPITHSLTGAIPLAGILTAYFKDDTEGEKQWLRNLAMNQIVTSVARFGFNYTGLGERPTGNPYGFPSGHVTFVGGGAAFLEERYGWTYGVPAWLATGYVAFVRVHNGDHHARDVVASAVLAYGIGKLFVTPENATHLAPVIGPDFLGMRWQRSW